MEFILFLGFLKNIQGIKMVKKRCFNCLSRYNIFCKKHKGYLFMDFSENREKIMANIDIHKKPTESEIYQLKNMKACEKWSSNPITIKIKIL